MEKTPCWGAVLTISRALWLSHSILPWFLPHPHSTSARSFPSPGGKVNFIENKFYKLLYGDGKGKTALSMWTCCVLGTSPQESASAKWIRPFPVSLLFSGPQFLWERGACGLLLSLMRPWASHFLLSASSWAPSLGHVPQATPFLSPLTMRASTASTLRHILKFLLKCNTHTSMLFS